MRDISCVTAALGGGASPGPRGAAARARFRCHAADAPDRVQVQRFIAATYARHFGARIQRWAPMLVSLEVDGSIVAAAGYRPGPQPLFLERYLDEPLECALAAHSGAPVWRDQIVEVGHLASVRAGASPRLMEALSAHLRGAGFRWAAVTATRQLQAIFARVGIEAVPLALARREALGEEAAHWGSYYEHAPVVLAVSARGGALRRRRGAHGGDDAG